MIAFELEDEIALRGKGPVFDELGCREKMLDHVFEALEEMPYGDLSGYALQRTLGYVQESIMMESQLEKDYWGSVWRCFLEAVEFLQTSRIRYILIGRPGISVEKLVEDVESTASNRQMSNETPELVNEVKQLMEEVRYYNFRRDQALARIETLLEEIREREERAELTVEALNDVPLDGSILQLRWSWRSLKILQELGIETVAEAVEYFSNFDNFADTHVEITLWEWSVITSVYNERASCLQKGWLRLVGKIV